MRKLGLALLTAAVASVTFVQGYVIDPQGLRWSGARATFHSYFDSADAQRAVAEAVRSWQSPLEDAVQLEAVAGSGTAAIGNATSEIGWESLPPEVVSLTRIVSRSGRIIEADVSVARDAASRGPWTHRRRRHARARAHARSRPRRRRRNHGRRRDVRRSVEHLDDDHARRRGGRERDVSPQ